MVTSYADLLLNPAYGSQLPAPLYTGTGVQQPLNPCEGLPLFQCMGQNLQQKNTSLLGNALGGITNPIAPPSAQTWLENIRGPGPTYTPAPPQPQINNELYDQRMAQLRGLLG